MPTICGPREQPPKKELAKYLAAACKLQRMSRVKFGDKRQKEKSLLLLAPELTASISSVNFLISALKINALAVNLHFIAVQLNLAPTPRKP